MDPFTLIAQAIGQAIAFSLLAVGIVAFLGGLAASTAGGGSSLPSGNFGSGTSWRGSDGRG